MGRHWVPFEQGVGRRVALRIRGHPQEEPRTGLHWRALLRRTHPGGRRRLQEGTESGKKKALPSRLRDSRPEAGSRNLGKTFLRGDGGHI